MVVREGRDLGNVIWLLSCIKGSLEANSHEFIVSFSATFSCAGANGGGRAGRARCNQDQVCRMDMKM